jgi:hypothetical protein
MEPNWIGHSIGSLQLITDSPVAVLRLGIFTPFSLADTLLLMLLSLSL